MNAHTQITEETAADHIELTADVVSAYLSNNHVQAAELPRLIASVHTAIVGLGSPAASTDPEIEKPTPTQIKKSISPNALISFLDGKPYKTLKRHLSRNGLTIEQYRERYGLPRDYPSTAASYSAQRSELARSLGLGQQRRKAAAPEPEAAAAEPRAEAKGRPAAQGEGAGGILKCPHLEPGDSVGRWIEAIINVV